MYICLYCLHPFYWFLQILWAFSLYLEAVAILPQLVLLQRTQNIDNLTGNYILLVAAASLPCRAYRALYILNWIYKLLTEDNYRQWIGENITVDLR